MRRSSRRGATAKQKTCSRSSVRYGTGADGYSYRPAISSDAGTVVFESLTTNLTLGGTAQFSRNIFAYDVQTGRATLVSIASDGSEGNGWSEEPDVSQDGRYVAFDSDADNLVADDTNFGRDIFVHDRDVDQDGYFNETGQVSTVRVDQSIGECMTLMTNKRVRHLPVLESNQLIGVISIGDVIKALISEQEAIIDQFKDYLWGAGPVATWPA